MNSMTIVLRKLDERSAQTWDGCDLSALERVWVGTSLPAAQRVAEGMGYRFKADSSLFGGRFVNERGNCLFVSTK